MWRICAGNERLLYLKKAADLMKNPEAFLAAMRRAIEEWPISAAVNLSTRSINRQAWTGHAGCCIAVGSPEEITRLAWHTLNSREQDEANAAADIAIAEWEASHA